MTRLPLIAIISLIVLFESIALSQAPPSWTQYGHNQHWQTELQLDSNPQLKKCWQTEIGEGRSQVVGDEDTIYVTSGARLKAASDKTRTLTTDIIAIDPINGKEKWKTTFQSTMSDDQEVFGGATPAPQSTPAIIGPHLLVTTFTGQLHCLDRIHGEKIWSKDLTDEFQAIPVQFGFSASIAIDGTNAIIMAAGKQGGMLNINPVDGQVNWKCELTTFSYATPTEGQLADIPQWIAITQQEVVGIQKADGQVLWSHPLSKGELTNVPSPLVIDNSSILISGQGCGGTRRLRIEKIAERWNVSESWFQPRLQLFYTNWSVLTDRLAIGCTDRYLALIDLDSGQIAGRIRGHADGNVLKTSKQVMLLNGKGKLAMLHLEPPTDSLQTRLVETASFNVASGRCWTPPTVIGDRIFVRQANQLSCLSVNDLHSGEKIINLLNEPKNHKIAFKANPPAEPPTQRIFGVFQTKGQQAALELYAQLRAEKSLNVDDRLELAEAAAEQSMNDLVQMILTHAAEDFPDSNLIRQAQKRLIK